MKREKGRDVSFFMELFGTAINNTWKLVTLGTFLALILVTLFLTGATPQTLQISSVLAFIPNLQHQLPFAGIQSPAPAPADSAVAVNATGDGEVVYSTAFILTQPFFNSTAGDAVATALPYHQPPAIATDASPAVAPAASPAVEEFEMATNSSSTGLDEIKVLNSSLKDVDSPATEIMKKKEKYCNIYEGKWVYKPEENPRYRAKQCPFLVEEVSCRSNGRPDSDYEGWSWESNDCQIPLFNGKEMVKKLRRKRMLIAGDSLARNHWESLACLLYTSLPRRRVFVSATSYTYKVLKALDYEFTLEFHWAPFLVNFNRKHENGKKVVMLDQMVPASKKWRGADVMVFSSGHWWTHTGKFKPWDMFEYNGEQLKEMKMELAYQRGLATWKKWLSKNVDPSKTKVFFRSISPEHKRDQWCYNASRPIEDEPYKQIYPQSMIDTIEGSIREINGEGGVHITYLNVTNLSSYRRDAHPSIFGKKIPEALIERSDCSHWCLPGLPDTWNRVLYATLLFNHFNTGELNNS